MHSSSSNTKNRGDTATPTRAWIASSGRCSPDHPRAVSLYAVHTAAVVVGVARALAALVARVFWRCTNGRLSLTRRGQSSTSMTELQSISVYSSQTNRSRYCILYLAIDV